ncbi:MAG: T9SS type A sorting domain-containing protein [Sphingobacteriaceae bacterium]|nr:T9SS type A sorting domain-containing protein [Sphingobacteriaceae bacterium]
MKKIYLTGIAICATALMSAQAFWTGTTYKGAFPITDNTPATDWTDGWCNWDPENTAYPATTTTVSADVTSNTTWSGVVLLVNKVFVKNNAVLTIQPGTIIRGDKTSQGTLIITKGAQINAAGTKTAPIVFTSNEAVGNRAEGDWGGVIILGKAINNQPGGIANIEGLTVSTDTEHGGSDDNDNSGTLTYCRIEFSGIPLQPNKEINGLTMGSVGKATTIRYVQVSFNGDDAFEWFGGTVDAKYLVSYRNLDDDFDTDFGYRGRIQFAVAVRDPDLSDAAGDSNCFESDNDGTGSFAQPLTAPKFSNLTIIGAKGSGTVVLPVGEKFEKAFRLRRNTATSCYNSLITGWEKGLSIEAAETENNFTGDTARFESNLLVDFANNTNVISAPYSFYSWFSARNNDSTQTKAQVNWVNAFPALGTKPDLRLNTASTASAGATFTAPGVFTGGFVNLAKYTKEQFTTITLSPNPSNGNAKLFINSSTNETINVNVEVLDITGKIVLTPAVNQSINFGYNNIDINAESLQTGIYFVRLSSINGNEVVKLIISK